MKHTVLCLIVSAASFAQEIPLSSLPTQMRNPVRDAVVYRMFLHHVAVFELQARANEAVGKSGEPFRNHLLHKFELSSGELSAITAKALVIEGALGSLRDSRRYAVAALRNDPSFTQAHHIGDAPLSLLQELKASNQKVRDLGLQGRDEIRSMFGESRFQQLDHKVRERFEHTFNAPVTAPAPAGK